MRTYVIADIGACHEADPDLMRTAILTAAGCGCDAVKFQWVSDPEQMARRRGWAYADGYASIYARYLAWPAGWHAELAKHCAGAGIDYMCTAFLAGDVATVAPHVARFKVASFEALDATMLEAHRPYKARPLLISAGMLDDGTAVGAVRGAAIDEGFDVGLLQCVSSYPAPAESLELALLGEPAPVPTSVSPNVYAGLSDHTDPALTWTGALAMAAGARVVEAHLRLDETDPANPDYPHAMTPVQFRDYVQHIRFAEACLGTGTKRPQPCEAAMMRYRVGAKEV